MTFAAIAKPEYKWLGVTPPANRMCGERDIIVQSVRRAEPDLN
jgi:hypothetical protein